MGRKKPVFHFLPAAAIFLFFAGACLGTEDGFESTSSDITESLLSLDRGESLKGNKQLNGRVEIVSEKKQGE